VTLSLISGHRLEHYGTGRVPAVPAWRQAGTGPLDHLEFDGEFALQLLWVHLADTHRE